MTHKTYWYCLFCILAWSCRTPYQSTQMTPVPYRITDKQAKDPSLDSLMQTYGAKLNTQMNAVIAQVGQTMEKERPESELGNVLADAMRSQSSLHFGKPVDIALINYGGVRVNQLNKGPLTRGKVYEIMPFDNIVILQALSGSTVQQLLDLVASKDGWPISGVSMQIRQKKAVSVWIGDKPLDLNATYWVANTDYVVNGGDDCTFLKNIPVLNDGYLLRDALIDHFTAQGKAGKPITGQIEKRIHYAQ